jgi:hypothetical protein
MANYFSFRFNNPNFVTRKEIKNKKVFLLNCKMDMNVISEGGFNQIIGNYLILGIIIMRIVWDVVSFIRSKLYNE